MLNLPHKYFSSCDVQENNSRQPNQGLLGPKLNSSVEVR